MVVNNVVNYCCKQNMLKETESEETFGFLHIFVTGGILIGEGGGGGRPSGYAYSLKTSFRTVDGTHILLMI